jgi:ABC-type sugar transport system permease subunit
LHTASPYGVEEFLSHIKVGVKMLSRRQQWLFLAPFFLIIVPFMIWPALFGLFTSVTNYIPFQKVSLQFVGFTNYARILSEAEFQKAIVNILVFTVFTVSIELLLGLLIAYRLRKAFRGRSLVRFILLIPWLISPVANGVMWHFLLQSNNGIPQYWGELVRLSSIPSFLGHGLALPTIIAVDIWRKAPLVMFLVLPGLQFIAPAYWDLADLEGMNLWIRLRHIVLPHMRLLLLTITLLLIGDALATSESTLILTGGGPASETITPGLYSFKQAVTVFDWTRGATSAWFIAAAVLLIGGVYLILVRREAI